MINLGLIDVFMLVLLVLMYVYSARRRVMMPFYVTLVLLALIELERLVPGVLAYLGNAVHGIDAANAQLPHIEISPIVTIK
ncbi:MAG: hypothetical protein KGJ80_03730 [Chloroflexota bacterium]|nr:hypothetical protein [Chloroflexota bacterium]